MDLFCGKGGWFWGREDGRGVQAPMREDAPARQGGVHSVYGSVDSVSTSPNVRRFGSEAEAREWLRLHAQV